MYYIYIYIFIFILIMSFQLKYPIAPSIYLFSGLIWTTTVDDLKIFEKIKINNITVNVNNIQNPQIVNKQFVIRNTTRPNMSLSPGACNPDGSFCKFLSN